MTDNEIIKALGCCINARGCDDENCPLVGNTPQLKDCLKIFLDLINRQQAENERLQKLCDSRKLVLNGVLDKLSVLLWGLEEPTE